MLPFLTLSIEGPDGARRAAKPIIGGVALIAILFGVGMVFPPAVAASLAGVLISAVVCFVVLIAMPRAAQISAMGAALGISADAGYAKLNNQSPVTVANGLTDLADSLINGIGIVAKDAHVAVSQAVPFGVWAFILSMIAFMGLSFLIKHDG